MLKARVTQPHLQTPEETKERGPVSEVTTREIGPFTPEEKDLIESGILKYAHVFHDEDTNDFNGTDIIEHHTIVDNVPPIRRPQYQTPYVLKEEIKSQIEKMLEKGL